jgi:hypothetical protein
MTLEISPRIQRNWRSANFDSELYVNRVGPNRNVDLVLDVYVHFQRIEPPSFVTDGSGTRHTVLSWGADWNGWVARCVQAIEGRFNNKLWLIPSSDWGIRFRATDAYYRPNIKCGLRIHAVGRGDRFHLSLNCYRVPSSFCPTTPAQVASAPIYRSYMAGNEGRIVNVDAWSCLTSGAEGHRQEVAAHEFGHYLGLDHVAVGFPGCPPSNTNAGPCYGVTVHQRGDLLGMGDRVEAWHSTPWLRRLPRHLGRGIGGAVTTTRPQPRRIQAAQTPTLPAPRRDGGVRDGGVRDGGIRDVM